ncbi:MAG: alpha/beta hydrolase [Burkholderiaceae bacterium]
MPRPAPPPPVQPADGDGPTAAEAASHARALRGAAKLATEATTGLTDLVEAVHSRIASVPGLAGPADGRTRGITGLVYKTIRGVTRAVGGSVDALLDVLSPMLAPRAGGEPASLPSPEREAILAALNGVLGDHLARTANPLAIRMALRHAGRALTLQRDALATALPDAGGKLLVLIHGLCMNDLQWRRSNGHDHGAALAAALGFTPVYLHYDSGLHVSTNGRALANQLEQLLAEWPHPIERFAIVGHSMGGLLARSALHYSRAADHDWSHRLDDLACLGTPHHGAPLERAGQGVDMLLSATPYAGPFGRLAKLRSAGITDLRHGNLIDEDWVTGDRFENATDRRKAVSLPAGPRCFAIAGTMSAQAGDLKDKVLGDGLVPVASALGKHRLAKRTLAFRPEHQRVFEQINHLQLLSNAEVFEQLRDWLRH